MDAVCDSTSHHVDQETVTNIHRHSSNVKVIEVGSRTLPVVYTSLTEGTGLSDLLYNLTSCVKELCGDPLLGNPSCTQARHHNHVTKCLEHIEEALETIDSDVVIAAERLRQSCAELGALTGVISSEDILDVVFKDFCIGK